MTVEMVFGALAPKLEEQLKHHPHADATEIARLQKDADALVRLHLRGIISDSGVDAARRKLFRKIVHAVKG